MTEETRNRERKDADEKKRNKTIDEKEKGEEKTKEKPGIKSVKSGFLVVCVAIAVGIQYVPDDAFRDIRGKIKELEPIVRSLMQTERQDQGLPGQQVKKVKLFSNGEHVKGKDFTIVEKDINDILIDVSALRLCLKQKPGVYCSLYTRTGMKVKDWDDFEAGDSLWLVPSNRQFVWPTFEVGTEVVVDRIEDQPFKTPIRLRTLSQRPRVFMIENLLTHEECDQLIENALTITDDTLKLKRSSTGAEGYKIASTRTSENAFDSRSETSVRLAKRSFDLVGMDYDFSHQDGLQILRYNVSKAYIDHLDYLEAPANSDHDYNSANEGTNRLLTVFMYLSDVESGGETVFSYAAPDGTNEVDPLEPHILKVRKDPDIPEEIEKDSWEEKLLAKCRSRLAVKPKKGNAVLFYSQLPDGRPDEKSKHGGCPVIKGQKWAANFWIWNGPRAGHYVKTADGKIEATKVVPLQQTATFHNMDIPGAELYYAGTGNLWSEMTINQPVRINTYQGHTWHVKLNGNLIKTWTVGPHDENNLEIEFFLRSDALDVDINELSLAADQTSQEVNSSDQETSSSETMESEVENTVDKEEAASSNEEFTEKVTVNDDELEGAQSTEVKL